LLVGVRAASCQEFPMIILGIILLIIGFVAKIAILWTIGIIAVVVGAVLAFLGMAGHAVGGRRHYF
jgi:membrane protein implicated in regulation of membrane protease activity